MTKFIEFLGHNFLITVLNFIKIAFLNFSFKDLLKEIKISKFYLHYKNIVTYLSIV